MTLQRVFVDRTKYVSSKDIDAAVNHLTDSEQEELITKAVLLGATFEEVPAGMSGVPAWVGMLDGKRISSVHRFSMARAAAEFLILYGVLPNTGPV